ncbi:MAG: hypothetical protein LDLANPLL_00625 [Turneriella sp.]|nr:hypothetical protein [Turneriella sp.]
MAYAFERIFFHQASVADRERIAALQILYPHFTRERVEFIDSDLELDKVLSTDLLVCCGQSLKASYTRIAAKGHVQVLSLDELLIAPARVFELQVSTIFGETILAFLAEPLKSQTMRMFSLFGFNPIAVDSIPTLLKELKHRASIVVFDQDMPTIQKSRVQENRAKIYSLLRAERKQRRQLSVIIIKDFDQGSLFADMSTLAKDVSNAMLSPQEFLEFIRSYLCDYHVAQATWKLKSGNFTGLSQASYAGRPTAHLGLSDIKSAFELFQDRAYQDYTLLREQLLVETHDLAVRMRVTEWLFDKQLAIEADLLEKNLLIRTQVPRALEKTAARVQISEPKTSEDASTGDVMFN